MKIYVGYKAESKIFYKFKETREDNENWYNGDSLSNTFEVYMDFNPATISVYPTLDIVDAKGRRITHILHDGLISAVAKEGGGYYYVATYTLGKRQIMSTGRADITIWMNKDGEYKKAVCTSAVQIIGTNAVAEDILIVSESNASTIVQSMLTMIEDIQDDLEPLDTAQADNATRLTAVESKNTTQDSKIASLESNVQIVRVPVDNMVLASAVNKIRALESTGGIVKGCYYSLEDSDATKKNQYLFIKLADKVGLLVSKPDADLSVDMYILTKNTTTNNWELTNSTDYFLKNSVFTDAVKNFGYNAGLSLTYGRDGVEVGLDYSTKSGTRSSSVTINTASSYSAGVMSASDKAKLDNIAAGATKYTDTDAVNATASASNTIAQSVCAQYTYDKSTIDAKLATLQFTKLLKVNALPTENINTNAIYLVRKEEEVLGDVYTEYAYIDNAWEVLGDTSVNLDDYVTTTELLTKLSNYVKSSEVSGIKEEAVDSAYKEVMKDLGSTTHLSIRQFFSKAYNETPNLLLNVDDWSGYTTSYFVALYEYTMYSDVSKAPNALYYRYEKMMNNSSVVDLGLGFAMRYVKSRGVLQFGVWGVPDATNKTITFDDPNLLNTFKNYVTEGNKVYVTSSFYNNFYYLKKNLDEGANNYGSWTWNDDMFEELLQSWSDYTVTPNPVEFQAYRALEIAGYQTKHKISASQQICNLTEDFNLEYSEQDILLTKLHGKVEVNYAELISSSDYNFTIATLQSGTYTITLKNNGSGTVTFNLWGVQSGVTIESGKYYAKTFTATETTEAKMNCFSGTPNFSEITIVKGSTPKYNLPLAFSYQTPTKVDSVGENESLKVSQDFSSLITEAESKGGSNVLALGINGDYNFLEWVGTNVRLYKKYGLVNLGELSWDYFDGGHFLSNATNVKANTINLVCPIYTAHTEANWLDNVNMAVGVTDTSKFVVNNTSYTDAAAFKSAMQGVYLIYELATPQTFELGDWNNTIHIFKDGNIIFNKEASYSITIATNLKQMVIQNGIRDAEQERRIQELEAKVAQLMALLTSTDTLDAEPTEEESTNTTPTEE